MHHRFRSPLALSVALVVVSAGVAFTLPLPAAAQTAVPKAYPVRDFFQRHPLVNGYCRCQQDIGDSVPSEQCGCKWLAFP